MNKSLSDLKKDVLFEISACQKWPDISGLFFFDVKTKKLFVRQERMKRMKISSEQAKKIEERHNDMQELLFQDGITDMLEYLDINYEIHRNGFERTLKITDVS